MKHTHSNTHKFSSVKYAATSVNIQKDSFNIGKSRCKSIIRTIELNVYIETKHKGNLMFK